MWSSHVSLLWIKMVLLLLLPVVYVKEIALCCFSFLYVCNISWLEFWLHDLAKSKCYCLHLSKQFISLQATFLVAPCFVVFCTLSVFLSVCLCLFLCLSLSLPLPPSTPPSLFPFLSLSPPLSLSYFPFPPSLPPPPPLSHASGPISTLSQCPSLLRHLTPTRCRWPTHFYRSALLDLSPQLWEDRAHTCFTDVGKTRYGKGSWGSVTCDKSA